MRAAGDFSTCTRPLRQKQRSGSRVSPCPRISHVILADGTRTLTAEGRWAGALACTEAHHGIGRRMLDGRQVAVVAALVAGDAEEAAALLADTVPGDPWEQAVTACLTTLCRRDAGQPVDGHLEGLVSVYLERKTEPGMTVFDTRLGLTVLDAIGSAESSAAHRVVRDLHRRTTDAEDGYAARENLAYPLFAEIASDRQVQDCRALVRVCGPSAGDSVLTAPGRAGGGSARRGQHHPEEPPGKDRYFASPPMRSGSPYRTVLAVGQEWGVSSPSTYAKRPRTRSPRPNRA